MTTLIRRITSLSLMLIAFAGSSSLLAQSAVDIIDACGRNIKFNQSIVENDESLLLSLAETITRQNYAERKSGGSFDVVFGKIRAGANYDDYRMNLDTYKSDKKFFVNRIKRDRYLFNAVDPDSTAAYTRCLEQFTGQNLFSAFVVGATASTVKVMVAVNNGNGPSVARRVELSSVAGGNRTDIQQLNFSGSGNYILTFVRLPKDDFSVVVNLKLADGTQLRAVDVGVPWVVKYTKITEVTNKEADPVDCNCGGPQNPTGSTTISLARDFSADDSVTYALVTDPGQYIATCTAIWTERNVPGSCSMTPARLEATDFVFSVYCAPGENNSRSRFRASLKGKQVKTQWVESR
jgi:hypothetical protein